MVPIILMASGLCPEQEEYFFNQGHMGTHTVETECILQAIGQKFRITRPVFFVLRSSRIEEVKKTIFFSPY